MPFEKLRHPQARERARTVLVSLERPPSAKGGRGQLRVRFGPEVCKDAGLTLDQRVELHWGYGEDAGAVLVVPGEDGPKLRTQTKRDKSAPVPGEALLETQFGGLPDEPRPGVGGAEWTLPHSPRPASKCQWRLHGGGVLVELPREWWAVRETMAPAAVEPPPPRFETRPFPPSVAVPPKPADDRIERVISMLERGLSTEEVRQHERCSPQFVHDCRDLLAKRKAGRVHPERRPGLQGDLARIREKALAVNGSARP